MNENIIHNENGDLTILKEWMEPCPQPNHPNYRKRMALVGCYCGNTFKIHKTSLLNGNTKSCGCYMVKRVQKTRTTHGHSVGDRSTPTYNCWSQFKSKCSNPNIKAYQTTGARGITVCDEWLTFEGFLKDMGTKPPGHRLNRIDKDGDFEPKNCEWVPLKRMKTNKRTRKNGTR